MSVRGCLVAAMLVCCPLGDFGSTAARSEENKPGGGTTQPQLAAWADASLPVAPGLWLWLDAAQQQAAWQAHGKSPLPAGQSLDVWYDGSGHNRHFSQPLERAQPEFLAVGKQAAVRFDGEQTFLQGQGQSQPVENLTIVLVAAPRGNQGGFRGLLATRQAGKNDFTSGLTVDLGPFSSVHLANVNVEGAGFQGWQDLYQSRAPFSAFHTFAVTCSHGNSGVRLKVNGQQTGERHRDAGTVAMEQIIVGARCYGFGPKPPNVRGFFEGDIAEILVYDRALGDEEVQRLTAWLNKKHAGLSELLAEKDLPGARRLKAVDNPPEIQMLLPGFSVRQLPLELTNINNLRYRADGKLVAVAYDGNIYLLSDSDGDGLEDKVETFWDNQGRIQSPIGMALTPPGYQHGQGLFVSSMGKLSLLVDSDGDDRADKEIVVAEGWPRPMHRVDALGVAIDRDGSVYFGIGTANFANGYLLDAQGVSQYKLDDERGTILRVSPDLKTREIVARGIRFPVALAFNRHGDLFATEQEGATWLANGNPFDELLHIQPGRYYGFPPRHPKHLPGVVDEPSVYDYTPQHQSTCGMVFNEPVNGGPVFGPATWQGDALVCGESRGKLYRTSLVKTHAGYVAGNQLLGCLGMLTVDACVSPTGDLAVAVHSGAPDWGTGPSGKGKLYKIRYEQKNAPQPTRVWAAGPGEVRIAFDRPLELSQIKDLAKRVSIEYGRHVSAADRFESIRPGYAVVEAQMATPRFDLPVLGVQVTGDRRTLVVATAMQSEAAGYAITLKGLRSETPGLSQTPEIDLAYDLNGLQATWQGKDQTNWSGWLPHPNPDVATALTASSADHERLWSSLAGPGALVLQTQLDLWNLLRPAVQPGSQLDYTPAAEKATLVVECNAPFELRLQDEPAQSATAEQGRYRAAVAIVPQQHQPLAFALRMDKPTGELQLDATWFTAEDDRPRTLPLRRFLLPWARQKVADRAELAERKIPELEGGNWARGRQVFLSAEAACSKCHRVRGDGGQIGPDLSNLVHRDYTSVLRDVREPSAAINPDFVASTIVLTDGRLLTGPMRAVDGQRVAVGDITGQETIVARHEIEEIQPSSLSIMPHGIEKTLGAERLRDLLTFLLLEPLQPAPLERQGEPPARTRQEIANVVPSADERAKSTKTLRILLVSGAKDHGPGEHDYPLWQKRWAKLLASAENVSVRQATDWPSTAEWQTADVAVLYSANPAWNEEKARELDAFLARGGGLVLIHFAVNGHKAPQALAERIGLAWGPGARFRHGPLDLKFDDSQHPITRGFEQLHLEDESYWNLTGDPQRIRLLASGMEDGQARPLLWTLEQGKGRVFVSIPGHYTWTFDDPLFRTLVLRGICWTAGEPADRLSELATIGARVQQ
jgi:putative heme-binding domain-containing protein